MPNIYYDPQAELIRDVAGLRSGLLASSEDFNRLGAILDKLTDGRPLLPAEQQTLNRLRAGRSAPGGSAVPQSLGARSK